MKTFTFDRVRGETVLDQENWQEEIIDVMIKRKKKCVIIRDMTEERDNPNGNMYMLALVRVDEEEKK